MFYLIMHSTFYLWLYGIGISFKYFTLKFVFLLMTRVSYLWILLKMGCIDKIYITESNKVISECDSLM